MLASKEKNTYIQKYIINKNESRNKEKQGITICTTCYYNRPVYSNGNIHKPAPCRSQTNHQPRDRSKIYRIGSVNLTMRCL